MSWITKSDETHPDVNFADVQGAADSPIAAASVEPFAREAGPHTSTSRWSGFSSWAPSALCPHCSRTATLWSVPATLWNGGTTPAPVTRTPVHPPPRVSLHDRIFSPHVEQFR